jgi:hypothetical protein
MPPFETAKIEITSYFEITFGLILLYKILKKNLELDCLCLLSSSYLSSLAPG